MNLEHHTSAHVRDADGRDQTIEGYIAQGIDYFINVLWHHAPMRERGRPFTYLRALDVGCDTAFALKHLQDRHGLSPYGCLGIDKFASTNPFHQDVQPWPMDDEKLALRLAARWGSGDPDKPEHPGERFDIAIFNHSLEHVENPHAALRTIAPVISPGGFIFIALPHAMSPWALWEGHYTIWTPPWLEQFMSIHGWEPVQPLVHKEFRPEHVEFWGVFQRKAQS